MSNVFSFTGTIGRDAEVRYTPSGVAVLSVPVANNIGYGDKQKTLWIRVILFGKRAEGNLKDYLLKGQQLFVSGQLSMNEYQAKDGTMKTSLELNANIVDLVGSRKDDGARQSNSFQPKQESAETKAEPDNYDDFDDDIPF